MGEAAEQMEALADAEISRLINLSRKTGFARDEDAPVRRQASFRKRTLVEIAMEASQKQAAAEAEIPAETPSPAAAQPEEPAAEQAQPAQTLKETAPQEADPDRLEEAAPQAPDPQESDPQTVPPQEAAPQEADPQEASSDPAALAAAELARNEAAEKQRAEQMQAEYDRGHAAGLAEGQARATAELEQVVAAFEKALAGLAGPDVLQLDLLQQKIEGAVLGLASARAGSQIDEMPEAFADRLEQLSSRIKEAVEAPLILLAEEDYRLIAPLAGQREKLAHCRFAAEAGLARGDVRIIAGGIGLEDVLSPAAPQKEAATEAENETEAATDSPASPDNAVAGEIGVGETGADETGAGETGVGETGAVKAEKEAEAEDDQ